MSRDIESPSRLREGLGEGGELSSLRASRLSFPPLLAEKLRASACDFVVTGGGGWIGQAALEMLESTLGDDTAGRVAVFGSSNRDLQLRSGRALPCRELRHIGAIGAKPKLFIHCAFLTKEKTLDRSIDSFVAANQKISDLVAAAVEASDVRGLFIPSSGAVYKKSEKSPPPLGGGLGGGCSPQATKVHACGTNPPPNLPRPRLFAEPPRGEETNHILDDDLQANAYGVMKIADEKRFAALTAKKSIPFCMPRLFNLSGPFINKHESYALASMIKNVLAGQPIAIRAAHRVVRSYIHVADFLSLAMALLLDPPPGEPQVFDTAGDDVLEMGDLADHIRKALGHPGLAIERPPRIKGRDDVYVGDGEIMRHLMQIKGLRLHTMESQIRDTALYLGAIPPRGS
jgi:UDP-glucuronate decarboxylase